MFLQLCRIILCIPLITQLVLPLSFSPRPVQAATVYHEHFDDEVYTDRWTITRDDGNSIINESGTELNVTTEKPINVTCHGINLDSVEKVSGAVLTFEGLLNLSLYGSMELQIKKDQNNYFSVRVNKGDINNVQVRSNDNGTVTKQSLGLSTPYVGSYKTFKIVKTNDAYEAYIEDIKQGSTATNSSIGDSDLTISLLSNTCQWTDGSGVNHSNFYDEILVTDPTDNCPDDPLKEEPGICGCGVVEDASDSDNDGTPDCIDACPSDPLKIDIGTCGCSVADTDTDNDGTPNCNDSCPADPLKISEGSCGCGIADSDTDNDGTPDCNESCDADPLKLAPGDCGCGTPDLDDNSNGIADCLENTYHTLFYDHFDDNNYSASWQIVRDDGTATASEGGTLLTLDLSQPASGCTGIYLQSSPVIFGTEILLQTELQPPASGWGGIALQKDGQNFVQVQTNNSPPQIKIVSSEAGTVSEELISLGAPGFGTPPVITLEKSGNSYQVLLNGTSVGAAITNGGLGNSMISALLSVDGCDTMAAPASFSLDLVRALSPHPLNTLFSANYSIPSLVANHGGGARSSVSYQIESDILPQQPVELSLSESYSVQSHPLASRPDNSTLCGIFIDDNAYATDSADIALDIACGSQVGCEEMSFSDNNVSWTTPEPYSTSKSWILPDIDGLRSVYVRYKNNQGEWSGECSDSIILDTTAPQVSMSPAGGIYFPAHSIAITASEPSTIYYTTDGSPPTTSSTEYLAPVDVSADTVIRAIAVDKVGNQGPEASESYTVCGTGNRNLSGQVLDVTLDPSIDRGVPGAIITLDSGQTATTDINGNYSITKLPAGYYNIVSVTTLQGGYVTYQSEYLLCKTSVASPEGDIHLTRDATVFGANTFSGYSSDGVNTSTGNYSYGVADLEIPGRGIPFAFERNYNSQDGSDGPLGYGWTHNFNISLTEDAEGVATVRWDDGKKETWTPDGSGGYTPMYGVYSVLTKDTTFNTFTISRKDMLQFTFNAENKLSAIVDENGNQLSISYNLGGNIDTVTDTVGRVVSFTYDASNRITRVLGPTGRAVNFSYGVNGDLISASNLNGGITRYTYDDNHQLLTMTDPRDNVTVTNVYDGERKVVSSQRDALGGQTLYSYDAATKTTQLTDPAGNVSYHHYDDMLRLIREDDANGNSSFYEFDERGNMVRVIDKNSNETNYIYDANGNVTEKNEPLGRTLRAVFDAKNNPIEKTDANGNTTYFEYDPVTGNLLSKTTPLGRKTSYTYTADGELETVTLDPDGLAYTTTNYYDAYGNKVRMVDRVGNETTYTYDGVGRVKVETNALGQSMAYEYDNMDNLLSITDANSGVSTFTYDANGNKLEHINAKGQKTSFSYDAKNRLTSTTNALGETESYGHDLLDRRTRVTNYRGVTTSIIYDPMGNIIQEVDALGNRRSNSYDPNGNKISSSDAKGNTTTYSYDALNRLTETSDPLGNTTRYTYDLNGNQLTVTDPQNRTVTNSYNIDNELILVADPLGNNIENEYDVLGRLVKLTDARLNPTSFEYDPLGRLLKVTDAENGVVTATYDELGNRKTITDTRNNTTSNDYDVLNRLIKVTGPATATNPLGDSRAMIYDSLGNLKSLTDASGRTNYSYDGLNRLVGIEYPDHTAITYTYDSNSNLLSVTDQMGSKSFSYDILDRVASITDPFGQTVGYTYDPNHNRSSIKYPGNRSVFYYYDELDRLSQVQDWGGITSSYGYDSAGRLETHTMGNDSTVNYSYDEAGRMVEKVDKTADGTIIASYSYGLDPNGNRTGLEIDQPLLALLRNPDTTFSYDEANRIISAGSTTFSHDGNGRLIEKDDGITTSSYAYDENDRLTRVTAGTDIYEYQYDSHGRRYSSTENGVETRYLLDLNAGMENVLAMMDSSNTLSKYYVHGAGLLYSFDPVSGERLYYHYDPLGSTIALADHLGNITDTYAYQPYGKLDRSETIHDNPFTYVGQFGVMQDPTGLYFMRARYYDPDLRRFLSVDPVKGDMKNSQTLSPYVYGKGNPVSYIDPKGEFAHLLHVFTAGLVVGHTVEITDHLDKRAGKVAKGAATVSLAAHLSHATVAADPITLLVYLTGKELGKKSAEGWIWGFEEGFEMIGNNIKSVFQKSSVEESKGTVTRNQHTNQDSTPSTTNIVDIPHIATATTTEMEIGETTTSSGAGVGSSGTLAESSSTDQADSGTPKPPKSYLNSGKYASRYFKREFSKLMSPNFVDSQTRTSIERKIDRSILYMQNRKYGYRTKEQKNKMKEKLARDLGQMSHKMYAQMVSAFSKHHVIVRDMASMPYFTSGKQMRTGVYAGQ